MQLIPIFYCTDMQSAINFYTGILDFRLCHTNASAADWVVDMENGNALLQLTRIEGDQRPGIHINVRVTDVDLLFQKYLQRGLVLHDKKESPVHQAPVNQSWGLHEFYITDSDGNTLRFTQPIP